MSGARDAAGPRVAGCDDGPRVLVSAADVEEHEPRLAEAVAKLAELDVAHTASDATVSSSAATEGRPEQSATHRSIAA